jgi:clan AA aspartic protease (TIGR02281 family)
MPRPYLIVQSAYDRRSAGRSIISTCAGAVFAATLLMRGLYPDSAPPPGPGIEASGGQLVTASSDGECYVDVRLNETLFRKALLDSGATGYLTIGINHAKRAGIDAGGLAFDNRYTSANGTGHFAKTTIATLRIGRVLAMRNVLVAVTAAPQDQIIIGIEILRMLNMHLRSTSCELNFWS